MDVNKCMIIYNAMNATKQQQQQQQQTEAKISSTETAPESSTCKTLSTSPLSQYTKNLFLSNVCCLDIVSTKTFLLSKSRF